MIKKIRDEFIYIFVNYFICNIPFWPIRKIFYKLVGVKIGKKSRILMKTKIIYPWRLVVGDYTIINENCYLDARGKIKIGSNVTIAVFSKLITGYHDIDKENFDYAEDTIIIRDNVAIFANCIVLAGANIKSGVVVSALSLVCRGDYEANGIYAGNPAKYIRRRESTAKYIQNSWQPWFR